MILFLPIYSSQSLWGHCQIPCGIYDDPAQFKILLEHVETLKKSITEVNRLAAEPTPNYNQLVRWVNNKDQHADAIKTIIAEYFLAQRIKIDEADYAKKLKLLHSIIVYAMKTKQSVDAVTAEKLETAIKTFEKLYIKKHDHPEMP